MTDLEKEFCPLHQTTFGDCIDEHDTGQVIVKQQQDPRTEGEGPNLGGMLGEAMMKSKLKDQARAQCDFWAEHEIFDLITEHLSAALPDDEQFREEEQGKRYCAYVKIPIKSAYGRPEYGYPEVDVIPEDKFEEPQDGMAGEACIELWNTWEIRPLPNHHA